MPRLRGSEVRVAVKVLKASLAMRWKYDATKYGGREDPFAEGDFIENKLS